MSELPNFPFVDQLDGSPNGPFNCVPACLCAGLRYLTGKSFAPDWLKSEAYGAAWAGSGTAASAFVGPCNLQGVTLYPVETDSREHAVARAHSLLASGRPVIFTQQDDYAPPDFRELWTHVCVWYKDTPTTLTAMDPFGAREITYDDAVWASRLRNTEVWTMEKRAMATIPQGWHDDGTTLTAPNGVPVKLGFREHVLMSNWDAGNVPLCAEYHSNQVLLHNPSVGTGQVQPFRDCLMWYTPEKGVIQEPYSGLEIYAAYQKIVELLLQLAEAQNASQAKALQSKLDAIMRILQG